MDNKNTKLWSVVSYITWIGWLASFFLHDKRDNMVNHHLNQALVINLVSTVGGILNRFGGLLGLVGSVVSLGGMVLLVIGIVRALQLSDKPIPVVGDIHIIG
ncbi:MAG: hypothetical protein E7423_06970 [Ruminococcaceae bacterium]|jgi:uncharacterized membrane protein|nr:hypothetical protein [Oscillospiraceae bacterium]